MLTKYDTCNRKFFVFDSFEGLPARNVLDGDGKFGVKFGAGAYRGSQLTFEYHLKKFKCFDETVMRVKKGWFNETMHRSGVQRVSYLRVDGDVFVSTWDALNALYSKVVPGGYIYVDDYGSFEGCRKAVNLFRTKHKIYEVSLLLYYQ